MGILLKKLGTIEELKKIGYLEAKVWGMSPVPLHQTFTAVKNGGIIIGAFNKEQMVGFIYSFPGFMDGKVYLCSHMMGIDPDYQNAGIGYLLKMKQAEEARKLGYEKIRWTYDPLESRNAYLNIAKLGAICSDYIENCYGEMNDGLNRGIASDRFNVEWLIHHRYLDERKDLFSKLSIEQDGVLLDWHQRRDGNPQAINNNNLSLVETKSPFLFVSIPTEFQKIKQADIDLAVDWRLKTRAIFMEAFTAGWVVCHVIRSKNAPVQYYVLGKKERLSFMN